MKQKLFAMLFCLGAICVVQAQVKVSNSSPLDVKFRRCVVNGSKSYIDLTLSNNTNRDCRFECRSFHAGNAAYDDEGNIYNNRISSGCLYFSLGGNTTSDAISDIPADVTIKLRIHIDNVDEYATRFTKVTIPIYVEGKNSSGEWYSIHLSNIPFTRQ